MNITAKVKLQGKTDEGDYSRLAFGPDYADGRNAQWALATPTLYMEMNVKSDVAAQFEVGGAYTLTFTQED